MIVAYVLGVLTLPVLVLVILAVTSLAGEWTVVCRREDDEQ